MIAIWSNPLEYITRHRGVHYYLYTRESLSFRRVVSVPWKEKKSRVLSTCYTLSRGRHSTVGVYVLRVLLLYCAYYCCCRERPPRAFFPLRVFTTSPRGPKRTGTKRKIAPTNADVVSPRGPDGRVAAAGIDPRRRGGAHAVPCWPPTAGRKTSDERLRAAMIAGRPAGRARRGVCRRRPAGPSCPVPKRFRRVNSPEMFFCTHHLE